MVITVIFTDCYYGYNCYFKLLILWFKTVIFTYCYYGYNSYFKLLI